MLWLFSEIWLWCVVSFLLGALVCGLLFVGPAKRRMAAALAASAHRPARPGSRTEPAPLPSHSPYRAAPQHSRAAGVAPPTSRTAIRYPQRDFDD